MKNYIPRKSHLENYNFTSGHKSWYFHVSKAPALVESTPKKSYGNEQCRYQGEEIWNAYKEKIYPYQTIV